MPDAGIVRCPRRPPGWCAAGPRPRPPADRPDIWPRAGEDLCYLAGDWRILQRLDGHRWSLDDLVTAWFAADECDADPPGRFVDLGCGIATVLLLLAWRFPDARGVGIEAQAVSVELAQRSIAWNGVEDRVQVELGDLRDVTPARGPVDLVTGTPPYLQPGSATLSQRPQRGPCTFEQRGGIEVYAAAASRLLGPTGVFVACEQTEQWPRVETAARDGMFHVTRRMDVIPRDGKKPLFTVFALRRDPIGRPRIDPPLIVRDRTGRRTPEFVALRADAGLPP